MLKRLTVIGLMIAAAFGPSAASTPPVVNAESQDIMEISTDLPGDGSQNDTVKSSEAAAVFSFCRETDAPASTAMDEHLALMQQRMERRMDRQIQIIEKLSEHHDSK
jgi:hypothetical protein